MTEKMMEITGNSIPELNELGKNRFGISFIGRDKDYDSYGIPIGNGKYREVSFKEALEYMRNN